jgi:PIN domain nuclease of toxin-antitoxin system
MARNLELERVSLDTHALYWFLEEPGKLSPKSERILKNRPRLIISIIVFFELLYMERKSGGLISLEKVLERLKSYNHRVAPVDTLVFRKSRVIDDNLELHDRIIVATALLAKTPLITKDRQISESGVIEAIW